MKTQGPTWCKPWGPKIYINYKGDILKLYSKEYMEI